MQARITNHKSSPDVNESIEVDTFNGKIHLRGTNIINHQFIMEIARLLENNTQETILNALKDLHR